VKLVLILCENDITLIKRKFHLTYYEIYCVSSIVLLKNPTFYYIEILSILNEFISWFKLHITNKKRCHLNLK